MKPKTIPADPEDSTARVLIDLVSLVVILSALALALMAFAPEGMR